ncbi:MAG: terminase small subunit [Defluviitaleaceae bacterium]|nr:terminase small subunit [Defluviitaleaceae bacterium]
MADKPLTERQKRFIDFYIETGNAAEAAKKAGYSGKTAKIIGAQNLTKLNLFIQEKLAAKDAQRIAGQDEVLQYLTRVLRGEDTEEVVVVEGTGDGCSEARTMSKALSPKDRIKAAELIGKRWGIFTENISMSGDLSFNIKIDYGD